MDEEHEKRYRQLLDVVRRAIPDFDGQVVIFTPGVKDGHDDSIVTLPKKAAELTEAEAAEMLLKFVFPGDSADVDDIAQMIDRVSGLAPRTTARVPAYEFQHFDCPAEERFYGYKYQLGEHLRVKWPEKQLDRVARDLGAFLTELHSGDPGPLDDDEIDSIYMSQWGFYGALWRQVVERKQLLFTEQEPLQRWYDRYFEDPANFEWKPTLVHGALDGSAFFDAESGALLGVDGWEGLTVGDPISDFVTIYRARGDTFLKKVLKSYRARKDKQFMKRLEFQYLVWEFWGPRKKHYQEARARARSLGENLGPMPPAKIKLPWNQ